MKPIRDWFRHTFSDPEVLVLTVVLLLVVAAIVLVARMVAPVIAALVIAFLLDGLVERLKRLGLGHIVSVTLVFIGFVLATLICLVGLMPVLTRQLGEFVHRIPEMMTALRQELLHLPQLYPDFITAGQIHGFISDLGHHLSVAVSVLPSYAGASVIGLLTAIVYIILILVLVFFMIKDKAVIIDWITSFLPRERELTTTVWHEVNLQIGNYVRGKVLEILIVSVSSYIVYSLLDVHFAILLAAITGLSVLIPYVGPAAATVPVALMAFVQWGPSWGFVYVMLAYGLIHAVDGNVVAPLLFSEAVNLHPIAIIVAILVFGGLWGFWGVFFAIPLATVVQAVLRAWPRKSHWRKPI